MSLEWLVLAAVTAFEAILLFFLTLPYHRRIRSWLIPAVRTALQPMLAIVPFAAFQLLGVYWKFETKPKCGVDCTAHDRDRYEKSYIKNQRNMLLASAAIFLYWLLWRYIKVANHVLLLEAEFKKLKD